MGSELFYQPDIGKLTVVNIAKNKVDESESAEKRQGGFGPGSCEIPEASAFSAGQD